MKVKSLVLTLILTCLSVCASIAQAPDTKFIDLALEPMAETGQLTGRVYADTNGNGTQDAGEPGIQNVDVLIINSNNNGQTVQTDANGDWIADVIPGSALVFIDTTDLPVGFFQTEGVDPSVTTVVANTLVDTGKDGYTFVGQISGSLYSDVNGSGFQNAGEPNLPNVDVIIEDQFGNIQTVETDANGEWSAQVVVGDITVTIDVTDPDFPQCAFQTEGTNPSTHNIPVNTNVFSEIDGFFESAEIFGLVYNDANGNGTQDAGEAGIPGADVLVTFSSGFQTTLITDANGEYDVRVPQGSTTIEVVETDADFPTGAVQTQGTNPTTFDAICGETYNEIDGFQELGTLEGHVYLDENGSSFQDAGEPNLPNVDVIIEDVFGNIQTVETDANGDWSVVLPAGTAISTIDVTDPDFPECAFQTEGTNPTTSTIVANETISEIDGFFESAEIFGLVYNDANGNGTQDAGEAGIPGADVLVTFSSGFQTTIITDANGEYDVRVPQGSTTIEVVETDADFPTGTVQTQGTNPTTFDAVCGETYNEIDGFQELGTLEGHVYLDVNGSSFQNAGEPDLPNVDVIIEDVFGNIQTVETDANGDWSVVLPAGTVISTIDVTDPDFPECAFQTEGTNPTTSTIVANETISEIDGFFESAEIFGLVYNDANGNGTQDAGEAGIPGADVLVTFSSGFQTTIITDANGEYDVRVPQGSTTIEVVETDADFPTGTVQTQGTNPTTFDAICGETYNEVDGFIVPDDEVGVLNGHLYEDTNGNGTQDAGEPNLVSIDVEITDVNGDITIVETDANGDWSIELPIGPAISDIDQSDVDFPLDAIQTEGTDPTTTNVLASQSILSDNDGFFINTNPSTVFGHLYLDANGSGFQNATELDLPNIDVIVTDAFGNITVVETDANGDYVIDLPPGDVTLEIDLNDPDFPNCAFQTEGTNPTTLNLAPDEVITDINGFFESAEIFGLVYNDTNANGTQDTGESGIPGVDVLVTFSSGFQTTLITDANGEYDLRVPQGSTTIEVVETDADFPSGAIQLEGTNPSTFDAICGETYNEIDGFIIPNDEVGILTGHLYEDTNGNGTQDTGEPNLANIDIEITDINGDITIVATDANGDWSIELPIGDAISDIDEADPDFPVLAIQTEGTDPSTTTVLQDQTILSDNDGFFVPDETVSAQVNGHLYEDTNANGTQDAGEPDLVNIDVEVTDDFGNQQTVATDASGDWLATVTAGNITSDIDEADVDFPAGFVQTEGTDPSTTFAPPAVNTFTENDGFTDPTVLEVGILTGHLYEDTNGNGTQDTGEPNLANIDIEITDINGDITIVATDANGDWSIELPIGDAISDIDEADLDFPALAIQTEGTDPSTTTVLQDQTILSDNDGFFVPDETVSAQVNGHLYEDTNANGTQDAGEPDLVNIDVEVTDDFGNQQTVATDASGDWLATVTAGNIISDIDEADVDFPVGFVQTEGTDPSTTFAPPAVNTFTENDGFTDPTVLEVGILTGHLYEDTNGNGTQDTGEPNLANIDIEITDINGDITIVTTDANGDWSIELPIGDAISDIDEADPDFPALAIQTEGTDPSTTTVLQDQTILSDNDGFFVPDETVSAQVNGHLYEDTNGNGTQDTGEPDLANIDVELTDDFGNQQTVATDASGDWLATVTAGNITSDIDEADVDFPAGFVQTEGTDPSTTFAPPAVNTFTENDGFTDPTVLEVGILTGHLYEDTNGNGTQDTGEPNLANIDIEITDINGDITIVTTDANGDWSIELPIGDAISDIDEADPDFPALAIQTEGTDPSTTTVLQDQTILSDNDGFFVPDETVSAQVNGHLYEDTNGNGTQDTGEPDLANIDVELTDDFGNQQTVATDASGDWLATVTAGNITSDIDEADVDFPAGFVQTEGTDPSTTFAPPAVNTFTENDGFTNENIDDGLIIYNAVSADGNGKNDYFKIEGIDNFPQNTVQIFNRQGNEVYNASGYNNASIRFEGKSDGAITIQKGDLLPPGVYFYVLQYVNDQGDTKKQKGYLYLNN
ncbi:C-terminal domain of CHU protein family protein [Psychroflexus salarius]|uniref:C-terminal domain of CHU protein family protein n=1 Tax=Psychroflexus salarius TaxID=1155689 RepID=A0A1M4TTL4_9FLAO|nr:SdrD B-like domain-containing protein [Psychroflexus salarius]SHE47821.1 C-terminal domain of CHU protein family protein [Psychroflexus salarius]